LSLGPIQWFGPAAFGSICEPAQHRPTPVGQACHWCGEIFALGDTGMLAMHLEYEGCRRVPWHRECFLRTISGSVAHVQKRCACYGGTARENDTQGMILTRREEAALAVKLWNVPEQRAGS